MAVKRSSDLKYSDVTPRQIYMNRRRFLYGAGLAGGAVLAGKGVLELLSPSKSVFATTKLPNVTKSSYTVPDKITPEQIVTTYNNYYEFGTDKGDPSKNAGTLRTSPWTVSVEGEVNKPQKLTMDDIMKIAPLEERVYRMRCVEAWSVVVPWIGYSFSHIVDLAQPKPTAKYVAFESFYDPRQMPLAKYAGIQLPYVEGLRMDEAKHPLSLLCVGMYGGTLPNQDGAPVRMVLPWKYGFKGIKSLVKIRFVKDQPPTTWNIAAPNEYGFYSNVNPKVDHPRWSQAKEVRLPGFFKNTNTLMFNGYPEVASMYAGMDLRKYY